jgi:hypothetical protein
MRETSPDVDQKCAVRSYLLTALTIIDEMEGMNKNHVDPVVLSKKPCRRWLNLAVR